MKIVKIEIVVCKQEYIVMVLDEETEVVRVPLQVPLVVVLQDEYLGNVVQQMAEHIMVPHLELVCVQWVLMFDLRKYEIHGFGNVVVLMGMIIVHQQILHDEIPHEPHRQFNNSNYL